MLFKEYCDQIWEIKMILETEYFQHATDFYWLHLSANGNQAQFTKCCWTILNRTHVFTYDDEIVKMNERIAQVWKLLHN